MKEMVIDYRSFIENNLAILDRDKQTPVPFLLNNVQASYYDLMRSEYGPEMQGVREIVLKARQQGMSSFILAMFTVDFLLRPYSISICISHRKDSTDLLFKKVKFYLDTYFKKVAEQSNRSLKDVKQEFLDSDNKNLVRNKMNQAEIYIGTAGAKVGGRGGSATNILFSECAFYQDTELITAQEIVLGTSQQVPQGRGMIFIESTANGEGNYYFDEWERANLPPDDDGRRPSIYKPRFFGWEQFYTKEWINEKRREFPNEKMFKQEYPNTAEEAFITSGTPYFESDVLERLRKTAPDPIKAGAFAPDGSLDIKDNPVAYEYRELQRGEQFVVFADPADTKDYCAAVALSKKHYDFPLVYNNVLESSQFGYELNSMCKYIFNCTGIWPKLAVERNTGQATIYVLKTLNYPDLFRMVDFSSQSSVQERGNVGWVTTGHMSGGELRGTRRKMLDDFALALKQEHLQIYDKTQIKQLKQFAIVKGRAQARAQQKDDLVMASAGAWQIHLVTPSHNFDEFDREEYEREQEKWRFK